MSRISFYCIYLNASVEQNWCKVWEVLQSEYIQNIAVQEVALHNRDIYLKVLILAIQYQLYCANHVALAG